MKLKKGDTTNAANKQTSQTMKPKVSFIDRNQDYFIKEISAVLPDSEWAICVIRKKDGARHLITTGGPDRYQTMGVLFDVMHDILMSGDEKL